MSKGLFIGAKVKLLRRMSVNFTKTKYLDICVGETGWIKGESKGDAVVRFVKQIKNKDEEADVKVKYANLALVKGDDDTGAKGSGSAAAAAETEGNATLPKGFQFLKSSDDDDKDDAVVVKKGWHKCQSKKAEETLVRQLHSRVGYSLEKTLRELPDYGDSDLVVITRGDATEIWTLKDFPQHKLAFGPEANEIKDRNWSQSRAALVKFDVGLHPQKLNLVIDGRLRSAVSEARPFSIFFAVTRVNEEKDANLTLGYAEVGVRVSIKLPWTAKEKVHNAYDETLPQVPIMYNKHKIKAHTRLTCTADLDLKKITEAASKKRAGELGAELKRDKDEKQAKKAKKED